MAMARFMRRQIEGLEDAVVLSTIPIVADLPEEVRARRWVYYCVDDFSVWPGLDSQPMADMERKFVRIADRIVAAGSNLAARMNALQRDATVISHGIDLEFWRNPPMMSRLLENLEAPVFLFWGLIDRRLDLRFLRTLDRRLASGTIALVGPEQDADPALGSLLRVKRLGAVPHSALPSLARQAAVLIMPYADLPVTRAMQPLKLKEYLASGRPVVSSRLPALAGWEGCLDVGETAERFADLVLAQSHGHLQPMQAVARQRLESETWRAKSRDLSSILFAE
jgi:glycosyltransferase involved in cell wall biosynthesis